MLPFEDHLVHLLLIAAPVAVQSLGPWLCHIGSEEPEQVDIDLEEQWGVKKRFARQ